MAPKKAAGKAASASKAAAGKSKAAGPSGAGGSKEARWARAQIAALVAQREAAVARGEVWVKEPHEWHEGQLEELALLIDDGSVQDVPTEVREAVEDYVAQLESGTSEENFYDDREIYSVLLSQKADEVPKAAAEPYARPEETAEAAAAAQQIEAWEETSLHGLSKFQAILKEHAASAGVQEAALVCLARLVNKKGAAARDASTQALAPKPLVPLVGSIMGSFPRDKGVQARGCMTLLALARAPGDLASTLEAGAAPLVVKALEGHITDPEVNMAAAKALAGMTNATPEHSPERGKIAAAGAAEVLSKLLLYPLDPRVEKLARQTIPFLKS